MIANIRIRVDPDALGHQHTRNPARLSLVTATRRECPFRNHRKRARDESQQSPECPLRYRPIWGKRQPSPRRGGVRVAGAAGKRDTERPGEGVVSSSIAMATQSLGGGVWMATSSMPGQRW